MALKMFKEVVGWDQMEKFYGEEINGIYTKIETFDRSFCKCGQVTATQNNSCKCGLTKFKRFQDFDYYFARSGVVEARVTHTYNPATDDFKLTAEVLKCDIVSNRERLTFTIEELPVISLFKTDYTIYDKDLLREVKSKDVEEYPHMKELLEVADFSNRFYYSKVPDTLDVHNIITILDLVKTIPNLLTDPDSRRFKNLTKSFISVFNVKASDNLPFKELMKNYDVDEKYFEILDRYCKDSNGYGSSYTVFKGGRRGYYWSGSGTSMKTYSEVLREFERNYATRKGHMFSTFYHSLMSGAIDLEEFLTILEGYNFLYDYDPKTYSGKDIPIFNWNQSFRDKDNFAKFWEKSYLSLFPVYYKENLYGKAAKTLITSFVEDLDLMKKYSIPLNEDSLKLKNFNYNLNERKMSDDLGIPSDKIEVFLDTFDRNPLAATSLLKDRRKLTKKQLDEYMELLEKDN